MSDNMTGFEWGTSYQIHPSAEKPTSYGLRIQPSKQPPWIQRYEPDEDHPCGAVAPVEYSDGTMPPRCIREAGHEDEFWHATEAGPPPYDKYPAMQWAPQTHENSK